MTTVPTFITLLTVAYVRQKCKGNALLGFYDNNGYMNAPQCYVIRTLPTLLKCEIKQFHGQSLEKVPKGTRIYK